MYSHHFFLPIIYVNIYILLIKVNTWRKIISLSLSLFSFPFFFYIVLHVCPFYLCFRWKDVLILDGSSKHAAHIWSISGISICWRHLVTPQKERQIRFLLGKDLFYFILAQHVLSYHYIQVPCWKGKLRIEIILALKLVATTLFGFYLGSSALGPWFVFKWFIRIPSARVK